MCFVIFEAIKYSNFIISFYQQCKTTFSENVFIKADTMITGNYADVNGIKMYYEIHGQGMPLVLIHGGGSTIETTFGAILPMLAQHYKCITVELQSHGRTSDRNAPESFTQDADDVAALLKHLHISKANILGFSNGGSTTLQIAIRHPELAAKIIVIAGAYKREGFIPGFFDGFKHAALKTMPQGLRDAFLKVNADSAALLNMFNKDVARMVAFKDWNDEDLKSITAPALIINGDKDVVLPEHALKMSQLIPNARLIILPGVHGECIGEIETKSLNSKQPEMIVELVKEFLDK